MDEVALTGETRDDFGAGRRRNGGIRVPDRKVRVIKPTELTELAERMADSLSGVCLLRGVVSNLELLSMTAADARDRQAVLRVLKVLKKVSDRGHAAYAKAKCQLARIEGRANE